MLDSAWLSPTKPGTAQESRFVFARSNSYKFFNLTVDKLPRADSPEEAMTSLSIPSFLTIGAIAFLVTVQSSST